MSARSASSGRAIVAAFALALVLTSLGGPAGPALGAGLGDRIAQTRRGQTQQEIRMRKQDRIVRKIDRKRHSIRKKVRRDVKSVKKAKKLRVGARRILQVRQERLDAVMARFDDSPDAPDPTTWADKLATLNRDVRRAQKRLRDLNHTIKIGTRRRATRIHKLNKLKRQRKAAVARQQAAEAALAGYIVRMTSLAQQRASNQTNVRLSADGSTFTWPSRGVVTQPFGCTGFRLNPPRGACRHFHDGVDLVAGYGSRIRSAAVGVVAFVGWNPWDEERRAFIVVVSHPGGYVTRYGHLIPNRKVRAGQLVHKGQVIGKMGSTGNSTGTHLHMELLKGTTPLNPFDYLPGGVVKVKHTKPAKKTSASHKKAKKSRRHGAHHKISRAKRRAAQRAKRRARLARLKAAEQVTAEPSSVGCDSPAAFYAALGTSAAEAEFLGSDEVITNDVTVETDAPCPWGETAPAESQDEAVTQTESTDLGSTDPASRAVRLIAAVRLPDRGTSPEPQ